MSFRKQLFALSALVLACATLPAQAKIVDLAFTGVYHMPNGEGLFGTTGEYVPFDYRITYDTDKNTQFNYVKAGTNLGNNTYAGQDFYSYSSSGIIASHIKLGNQSFQPPQLVERAINPTLVAGIWFDRDISKSTPTATWMYFGFWPEDQYISLQVGGAEQALDGRISMYGGSLAEHYKNLEGEYKFGTTSELQITVLPEPETYAMMGFGLFALVALQKRRAAKA